MKENETIIVNGSGKLTKILWVVTLVAVLGLAYYLGSQMLKTQAVQGCMQVARLETKTSNGETVTIPENYWYTYCLKETGYQK